MSTAYGQPGDWIKRAPGSLTDPTCPAGHVITESQDFRWLLRVAAHLDRPEQRQLQIDLEHYLAEACPHHYHDVTGWGGTTEEAWQCLWCHAIADSDNFVRPEYPAEVA